MKLLITLSAVCMNMLVHAQISIGVRGGLVGARIHYATNDPDYDKMGNDEVLSVYGFGGAIPIEFKFGKHFALQTELGLTQKGWRYEYDLDQSTADSKFQVWLTYAEFSLLPKLIIGSGKLKGHALGGLTAGKAVKGVYEWQFADPGLAYLESKEEIDLGDDEGQINPLDLTLLGGMGASFSFGRSAVVLEGRYLHGLVSLANNDGDFGTYQGNEVKGKVINQAITVQLGYMIRLGKSKEVAGTKAPAAAPPAAP